MEHDADGQGVEAVSLVGLPSDAHSSFLAGAAEAPAAIRSALASEASHLWSELGADVARGLEDLGDLEVDDAFEAVEERLAALFAEGRRIVALGGDHAVTLPVLRALRRARREPFSVLHLDAHPDLYDDLDGDPLSHASPFARLLEEAPFARVVQVGIRSLNPHLREQIARFGVEVVEMREWERVHELEFDTPVYLSLDLDVLDPACAPGVSHWEPGGATTRQLLDLIHRLRAPLLAADVVELNPRRDPDGRTAALAARAVREIAGKMLLEGV